MKKGKILVAEDNELNRETLQEILSELGYEVKAVEDGRQGIEAFLADKYDLVITDLRMPHVDGLEFLKLIKEANQDSLVIIVTGHGTVNSAVSAMKLGAFDFITKPIDDNLVKLSVSRAINFANLRNENITLKEHLKDKESFHNIIGYSDCMKKVFETIDKVSASDSTVLITGESGTGKELVARAIHFKSDRRDQPMIPVNCGAIPEELLESELFGHEKGAFTGAIRSRMGRFELAQGGTIFLDEIGDMSPALQVKVLRVIQERQFERIGGVKTINADVRIIAATNQDLEKAVSEKQFREDLFYRINVIPVNLPPLRERGSDITILARHFLMTFNKLKKKNVEQIAPGAINYLMRYNWPGNVRELQNLLEMLVVMKEEGTITEDDLPAKIRNSTEESVKVESVFLPEEGIDFNNHILRVERDLLLKALKMSGGVKNRAAKLLNLNRTTLVEKLKRLDIRDGWID
ncbi:MAG: sigma-54 dependent transcriptional regulator [Smithellaceae bacterium]|jgi:DNA-binding NtrC family response regulator|nr:sigma-54-dependent Fis family transcriptional regulator [Syntrophaceae bacterium]